MLPGSLAVGRLRVEDRVLKAVLETTALGQARAAGDGGLLSLFLACHVVTVRHRFRSLSSWRAASVQEGDLRRWVH